MNVAMLGRENLTPQKRAELKADIEAELQELTLVTNELVAIAADNARTETPTPVDVVAVVKAASLRWEKRSQRTVQLSLSLPTAEEGQFVLISPTAFQRIVDNLVSNAVKFSPNDTVIEVGLHRDGSHVALSVRDHGPGIIASDLPHVFDRFYRSEQARAVTGSGLGLAIVKELVERASGSVTASNAPEGGAKLEVRFRALAME
jgi:two-component system sensor histidine kinase MprB